MRQELKAVLFKTWWRAAVTSSLQKMKNCWNQLGNPGLPHPNSTIMSFLG